jgi:hypothetical protein
MEYEMDFDYDEDHGKHQTQVRISKQKQQQYLDYKDVTDTLMSLLSTAEAIALKNSGKRELGYYDEYDTSNRKGLNSQIIQLLRLIREFGGMKTDFNTLYKEEKYKLPSQITPEYIQKNIIIWKSHVSSENIKRYFDEILNVLNGKPTIDINNELKIYYDKSIHLSEEQIMERWENIIEIKHLCSKEDEEVINEYLRTGKYVYNIRFNEKAGRHSIFLYINFTLKA